MTPQGKAQELFEKYAMYLRANLMYDEEANEDAKQCALVAVDEIIEANPTAEFIGANRSYDNVPYWMKVKQEIEKL
jgi:hypothetical protein